MTDDELALYDEALDHVGDDDDWYESSLYLVTVAPPRLRALVAEARLATVLRTFLDPEGEVCIYTREITTTGEKSLIIDGSVTVTQEQYELLRAMGAKPTEPPSR